MNEVDALLRDARSRMEKTVEHYQDEFAKIRTAKASPALVENIQVDYYGNLTRLREIAGISTPEPRLIVVQPWDPSAMSNVMRALSASSLGITPVSDGKVIRLPFPELDEERRKSLDRVVKKLGEEGRVAIRNIRRETNEALKKLQKEAKITEDDYHREENEVQKATDDHITKIDDLLTRKEKEIMEV